MIGVVLVAALAALWGWKVLNQSFAPPPISTLARLLRRLPRGDKLVGCPWCIGAWLSIVGVVSQHAATGNLDWVQTPAAAFAAAGLTGLLGSVLPDDGTPS